MIIFIKDKFYDRNIWTFYKENRDNIYKIFSKEVITNFNSDEFELILNGRPYIDIEEWKIFTEYKEPYNNNHCVIKRFWEILNELNQKELNNLLLFLQEVEEYL